LAAKLRIDMWNSARKLLLLIVMLLSMNIFAQQDPQYSQNMFNHFVVNPAVAGMEDALVGDLMNRNQWSGVEGAPTTSALSVQLPVRFIEQSGIGLNMISDKIGAITSTGFNLGYSYRVQLGNGDLGFGLGIGVQNWGLNPDGGWEAIDGADNDPLIPNAEVSEIALDMNFGVFYREEDFYGGFSVTHLNQPVIEYETGIDNGNSPGNGSIYLSRHYYLMGGYNFKLNDPLFELRPSVFIKTDMAAYQLDLNCNLFYDNRLWGGLSYRINDAVVLLFGTELLNGLRIGYSYDIQTSALARYGKGSHEIHLSYSLQLEIRRNSPYKSVRYL